MNLPSNPAVIAMLLEEDLNELYEHAPCGFISTLPDGTIIKCNATFLEWTGYSRGLVLEKRRFQDLLPAAGKAFYDAHFSSLLLRQGCAREISFDLICANGTPNPILLNATLKRDERGQPQVIRTILLDARSRRAYEEELRLARRKAEEAEAAARHLNESLEARVSQRTEERDRIWRMSQDILAIASSQGKFTSFNPSFTRLLGWTEEEGRAMSLRDLAHPEHRQQLGEMFAKLSTGAPVTRVRIPCRHKNGACLWISWTIMPEGDQLYAVGRDITDQKQQEDMLHKTEEALHQAQKMEAIGKLTGGIAHDFNNILQVIAGNLELLKLNFTGDEQAVQRMNMAIASVKRGAKLASQLLAFARRQALHPVPTDLGRILRGMDELLRRALGESIEIETIVGAGLWNAMVDRNHLENVILNLAINARDAMHGRGKLTLELGNAQLDERYAHLHADVTPGQYVMLAVSDTGTGIAPDIMDKIFEPFFTTKGEEEGTGLGLSMVYGFVKQSGGHIKVYSELGHGTQFKIYLPRVHQPEAVAADSLAAPVKGGEETILVVEDDPAVQATVVDMLTNLGYQVLKARDGESALTVLASGQPIDLLFTDVVMPGTVRGAELARQAKSRFPDIEILFTSGYTQNAILHAGHLEPGVELISKPYGREDLARKLHQMLANKRKKLQDSPMIQDSIAPPKTPAARNDAYRILVVEDSEDANLVLCEVLRYLGHAPEGVCSAEDALKLMASTMFDVLMTDVRLPGMPGTELAKQARLRNPDIKIIFSSGFGDVHQAGMESVSLPKPYDLDQVKEILNRIKA
ncbi:PAS domain S-box-containing protein [Paucimonas lemoignei]|uniref:histidine kinase n=1 Tax=Paucimonas lemoignei TaxID=29443 RepID=A0A4R3HZ43_PAULE|nr:response regulator [Paucimonas lemoignei]TCS37515.1 PAS domain S-box-containing protein [Paucimonas lemoignei]